MPVVVIGSWIVTGLIIGFIASKFAKGGDEPGLGILVTGVSALVLALGYSIIRGYGVSAFTMSALIVAAIGAAIGAAVWHIIRSRFVSHEPQTVRRSY
jgi:uncharacterized membrane protein YeaQ/YmgE (transglycosylase-associated protein family)